MRRCAGTDADGNFIKVQGEGVSEETWAEVVAYADEKDGKKDDHRNLNLRFESRFLAQPAEIRERTARQVEGFAHEMLTEVLSAGDTAPLAVEASLAVEAPLALEATLAVEAILAAGSCDLGARVGRIEDPGERVDETLGARRLGQAVDRAPPAGRRAQCLREAGHPDGRPGGPRRARGPEHLRRPPHRHLLRRS